MSKNNKYQIFQRMLSRAADLRLPSIILFFLSMIALCLKINYDFISFAFFYWRYNSFSSSKFLRILLKFSSVVDKSIGEAFYIFTFTSVDIVCLNWSSYLSSYLWMVLFGISVITLENAITFWLFCPVGF